MIEIQTTKEQKSRAIDLSSEMGSVRHSMLGGLGNITGFLGEVAYADYYGLSLSHSYDYDLLTPTGKRVDVKSKSCSTPPLSHYYVAVETRFEQDCDFYVFTRVRKNLSTVWLLGWMPTLEFRKNATHFPAGTPDPSFPSFRNKLDNLQMQVSELRQFV